MKNTTDQTQLIAYSATVLLNDRESYCSVIGYTTVAPREKYTAVIYSVCEDGDYNNDVFAGIDAKSINYIIIPKGVLIDTLYNITKKE